MTQAAALILTTAQSKGFFSKISDCLGSGSGRTLGTRRESDLRSPPSSLAPPDGPPKQNVIDSQGESWDPAYISGHCDAINSQELLLCSVSH